MQVERVTQERDEVAADCHNVERAFRDLSQKYERTREVVARLTETESGLKLSLETLQVRLRLEEEKYDRRKGEAEEGLSKAAVRLADTQRTNTREIARLSALLRKAEMNVSSLEVKINQKVEIILLFTIGLPVATVCCTEPGERRADGDVRRAAQQAGQGRRHRQLILSSSSKLFSTALLYIHTEYMLYTSILYQNSIG